MEPAEECLRLRVYAGESDQWERRPLYEAIVLKARSEGLAGATVFRSPMGFGATSRIHTAKILNSLNRSARCRRDHRFQA